MSGVVLLPLAEVSDKVFPSDLSSLIVLAMVALGVLAFSRHLGLRLALTLGAAYLIFVLPLLAKPVPPWLGEALTRELGPAALGQLVWCERAFWLLPLVGLALGQLCRPKRDQSLKGAPST